MKNLTTIDKAFLLCLLLPLVWFVPLVIHTLYQNIQGNTVREVPKTQALNLLTTEQWCTEIDELFDTHLKIVLSPNYEYMVRYQSDFSHQYSGKWNLKSYEQGKGVISLTDKDGLTQDSYFTLYNNSIKFEINKEEKKFKPCSVRESELSYRSYIRFFNKLAIISTLVGVGYLLFKGYKKIKAKVVA